MPCQGRCHRVLQVVHWEQVDAVTSLSEPCGGLSSDNTQNQRARSLQAGTPIPVVVVYAMWMTCLQSDRLEQASASLNVSSQNTSSH